MGKFMRLPEVKAETGYSGSSIYALVKEKKFPAPIKLGPRARAWDSDEVDEWKAERKAERDARAAMDAHQ